MGELGEPDAAAGSPVDHCAASKTGPSAICGNPLCRKRWKQLAELSFPVFCPACRVQAEALLPEEAAGLDGRWRALLEVWNDIATEIEALSGLAMKPWPRMFDGPSPATVVDWEASFWSAFPKPPDRHVTTWNGMKKLRQMLRVRVLERRGRVLLLEPLAVLDPKTLEVTDRPVEKGAQLFLVDWTQDHNHGDEVVVIAMPNPAKTERKYVPFIVKIPHSTDPDDERPASKTSGRWAPSGLPKPGPPPAGEPPAAAEKPKRGKKKRDEAAEYDDARTEQRPRRGSGQRGGYGRGHPTLEGPRLDQAQGWYSSYQYPPHGDLGALAQMHTHQQHHLAQTQQQQQQQYAAALAAQMVSPMVAGWGVAPVAGVLPSGVYVAPDGTYSLGPQMHPAPPWTQPAMPPAVSYRDEPAPGPKAWKEGRQRKQPPRSTPPLTPEPAGETPSPKAEGRATTPTPSLFPPTPSPAFQSALPMRMPYLNMDNFAEDLPEAPESRKSVKAKGKGTPSSGRQTPVSASGLKKQKSYPTYGPTPSPVYAQMQAGLLTLSGASDAPKKQGAVSNQFESLMSWVNDDGEGANLGQLPSWEEEQADPGDDEPQLPLSGQTSPEFAAAAARPEPLTAQHIVDAAAAAALRTESSRSPGASSLSPQLRPIGSPSGSPTRERLSPSAPRSSSPRQSPLQTILEEWPDLNPPDVLPEPKRVLRPRPPWVKDKPAS